jgi:uncharacterized membrane protein
LAPSSSRKDPETGKVRVLYIGDYSASSPYPTMEAEPMISLRFAWPSAMEGVGPEVARRMFRQYIPRSYAKLAENDAIIISDADVFIFEHQHYQWFKDAVIKNGSGLVMIGGNAGFGGRPNPPWGPTVVQDILPVWCITGGWTEGRVEILEPEHGLLATLPLKQRWPWMAGYDGNEVILKEEAELLAEMVGLTGKHNPFWATWDIGEGRCFAMTCDWTPAGGVVFMRWAYYGDFAVNLMMFLSDNPIPSDLETVHKVRTMYVDYRSTRAYLFSVMDFAEKLGANTGVVNGMIAGADMKYGESVGLYIDFEFEGSMVPLDAALSELRKASARVMQLKDQAMLWIYLIEWSVVTATFALGGIVLWSLMVRRKLYREVQETRFQR